MKIHEVVTIGEGRRLAIPEDLFHSLGWKAGEKLVVTIEDEARGVFSIRKATASELGCRDVRPRRRKEASR